jgi:hypothetical protein
MATKCICPEGGIEHSDTAYCSTCTVGIISSSFVDTLDYLSVDFDFVTRVKTKTLMDTSQYCQHIVDPSMYVLTLNQ